MKLKMLLQKEVANAFAQRKFIYMTLVMSVAFPIFIPMFDSNGFLNAIIPTSLMATFIPNIVALSCSSQLVANSHIEEVKSNIPKVMLYRKINRIYFFISKISIPFIVGFMCAMLSSIIFHYISGPLTRSDFLLVIIANIIWSVLPAVITLLLSILNVDNEVTLNSLMMLSSYIVYGVILYVADPFSNITMHVLVSMFTILIMLIICHVLINMSIPKLEVISND